MSEERPRRGGEDTAGARSPAGREHARRTLRWALRAYPPAVREREGDMLLSLAADMVDTGSSAGREALGLLRGGIAMRFGTLARAPWEPALHRAAIQLAGVMAALTCGAAWWWQEPAWPGWSWVAALVAPALVLGGQLAGRRAPVACGAVLLIVLGVAQANSALPTLAGVTGSIEWGITGEGRRAGADQGISLPLFACAIPAAVLLLASAAHARRPVRRSVAIRRLAWVAAGVLLARVAMEVAAARNPAASVTIAGVSLDGLGLSVVIAGLAAAVLLGVGVARRRRDPAGTLAAALALAAVLPVACLYALAAALDPTAALLALTACMVALTLGFAAFVRRIPRAPSRA